MTGIFFVNAAEIIRHTSNRWKAEDQKLFEGWLRNTLYPLIKNFYPTANGNWDAAMNQTMMSMGIFLDDRDMFNRGMNHALGKETNGSIPMYFNDFGECQENGRDQGHTQMGMNFLSKCCEIAWKQGIDMYGTLDNRLAKGFEYTSKIHAGQRCALRVLRTAIRSPTIIRPFPRRGGAGFRRSMRLPTTIITTGWGWRCPIPRGRSMP